MRYPEAPRLDLVEDLHGHSGRRSLPLARGPRRPPHRRRGPRRRTRWPPRCWAACRCASGSPQRLEQLVHAGAVGVPVWRGHGRSPPAATPARSTPSCASARPTAAPRVLVDPMALDPEGTTTLDAWSPSWEGDRLAYQLSTGGDEESRLYVARRRHRRGARRARSTAAATPPSPGCPVARSSSTSAGWRPTRCRPARSSSTAACGATAWARPGRRRRPGARRGQRPDHLLRRAHQPRRALAGGLRLGRHRAARRRLDRRPRRGRRAARRSRSASTRRPPRGWPATAGCG